MLVEETETETYSKRFDMIACINGSKTFAPVSVIYAPSERAQSGVKGIHTEMLLYYIYSTARWGRRQPHWTIQSAPHAGG